MPAPILPYYTPQPEEDLGRQALIHVLLGWGCLAAAGLAGLLFWPMSLCLIPGLLGLGAGLTLRSTALAITALRRPDQRGLLAFLALALCGVATLCALGLALALVQSLWS